MPLPRPKGLHPSIARLRNQPDKHVGEPTLYGAAHQNDMASPPPKAPHGPHGPHGAQGPQGQGTHSPEFRIRKVVKEPEKPENQPVVGLKGSQPLISLTESDLSSADTMPTFVKKRPSVAGAGAVAVPISSAKTENASFSYESSSSKLPTIAYADLLFLKQIGGGGFGAVWQGVWRGTPVAIKVLTTTSTQSPMEAAFGEEVAVLERMRHPNICLLLGVCWEDGRRAIVTELVSRGSLWDALRTPFGVKSDGVFHWPQWLIRKVLEGAGRGLIYLHRHNPPIIHRDLKSPNLLLDDSFNVKICDFGLARLRDLSTVLTANVGTVQWMAPEVLTGGQYDESADIYSMGLVAWEMMTGRCPYEGMKQMEIAIAVVNNRLRPTIPTNCTQHQYYFLQRCWSAVPGERFRAEDFTTEVSRIFNVQGPMVS